MVHIIFLLKTSHHMCNTPSVSLHVNHEHCINISIIMITCHFMYTMYD